MLSRKILCIALARPGPYPCRTRPASRFEISTPAHRILPYSFEPANALAAAFLAHLVMCGLLFLFGMLCRFHLAYLVGWLLIAGCLVLEHWIARRRSLNWINLAFFRLNALVSAVFLVVTLAEVMFKGPFQPR